MIGTGICCPTGEGVIPATDIGGVYAVEEDGLAEQLGNSLSGEDGANKIVGIVVEGSSIAGIRFQEVVRGMDP